MEGNLCWNCQHIVCCEPSARPCYIKDCDAYVPLEEPLTHKQIALCLGTTIDVVKKTVVRDSPAAIVEKMQDRGVCVRFIKNNKSVKFYKLV